LDNNTPRAELLLDLEKKVSYFRSTGFNEAADFYEDCLNNQSYFSYSEIYEFHSSSVDLAQIIVYETFSSVVTAVVNNTRPFIEFALFETGISACWQIIKAARNVRNLYVSSKWYNTESYVKGFKKVIGDSHRMNNHIFVPTHNLSGLVSRYGSNEKVVEALYKQLYAEGKLSGAYSGQSFNTYLSGHNVTGKFGFSSGDLLISNFWVP